MLDNSLTFIMKTVKVLKVYTIFILFFIATLTDCLKAKRAPYDTSSPTGLIRNLIIQALNFPNRPPIIKSFKASTTNVSFGKTFQINWEVEDPDGDAIKCDLDLEPDGIIDYTLENCKNSSADFTIKKTGLYSPTLRVSDQKYQIQSPIESEKLSIQLAGELDTSFQSYSLISPGIDGIRQIKVRPDGKILVLGRYKLILLKENGEFESEFLFTSPDINLFALFLQKDEKIIVAGYYDDSSDYFFYIARLNSNLTWDLSFGTSGQIQLFNDNFSKEIYAIQVDESERILLVGHYNFEYAVLRLLSNGNLDTSFAIGGMKTFTGDTDNNNLYRISLLADGKLLVTGEAADSSDNGRFVVARLNTNGSLDTGFGVGGIGRYEFSVSAGGGIHTLQRDGKILLCGVSDNGSSNDAFSLVRFHENGAIDSSFGNGGLVTTQVNPSNNASAYSVFVQEDGKILASGETNNGANIPLVIRFHENGAIDTSFGVGGKYVHSSIGNSKAGTLDNQGRLLIPAKDNGDPTVIRIQ